MVIVQKICVSKQQRCGVAADAAHRLCWRVLLCCGAVIVHAVMTSQRNVAHFSQFLSVMNRINAVFYNQYLKGNDNKWGEYASEQRLLRYQNKQSAGNEFHSVKSDTLICAVKISTQFNQKYKTFTEPLQSAELESRQKTVPYSEIFFRALALFGLAGKSVSSTRCTFTRDAGGFSDEQILPTHHISRC